MTYSAHDELSNFNAEMTTRPNEWWHAMNDLGVQEHSHYGFQGQRKSVMASVKRRRSRGSLGNVAI